MSSNVPSPSSSSLLGFVFKLTEPSTRTVNGSVTGCTSSDLGPFAIAPVHLARGILMAAGVLGPCS